MKYALLIYGNPDATAETPSAEEFESQRAEYLALRDDPRYLTSGQLQPVETATTVRVQDGRPLITDGPYADIKEVFGGFYVFEADDLEQAIELAARVPAARVGGAVEIRPLVEQ